jgi:hypothetical protein
LPTFAGVAHTRDRGGLLGKLAETLRAQRPTRKVSAMFIDMGLRLADLRVLRALGFHNVFEVNFGLTHPGSQSNMRALYVGQR